MDVPDSLAALKAELQGELNNPGIGYRRRNHAKRRARRVVADRQAELGCVCEIEKLRAKLQNVFLGEGEISGNAEIEV